MNKLIGRIQHDLERYLFLFRKDDKISQLPPFFQYLKDSYIQPNCIERSDKSNRLVEKINDQEFQSHEGLVVTNSVDLENTTYKIFAQEPGVLVLDCTKEVDADLADNVHQQQRSYNANKKLHIVTLKN